MKNIPVAGSASYLTPLHVNGFIRVKKQGLPSFLDALPGVFNQIKQADGLVGAKLVAGPLLRDFAFTSFWVPQFESAEDYIQNSSKKAKSLVTQFYTTAAHEAIMSLFYKQSGSSQIGILWGSDWSIKYGFPSWINFSEKMSNDGKLVLYKKLGSTPYSLEQDRLQNSIDNSKYAVEVYSWHNGKKGSKLSKEQEIKEVVKQIIPNKLANKLTSDRILRVPSMAGCFPNIYVRPENVEWIDNLSQSLVKYDQLNSTNLCFESGIQDLQRFVDHKSPWISEAWINLYKLIGRTQGLESRRS